MQNGKVKRGCTVLSDAHFLAVAHIIADAGTCSRLHVGAVLVYSRRIISTGYNGAPAGMPHCAHPVEDRYPQIGVAAAKERGCHIAVHAETNAIAYSAKNGIETQGSVMYITDSPCYDCAKLIVNAGIKEVKYGREYRIRTGIDLLEKAGIRTEELGEPNLYAVRLERGDRPSVHSGQSSDEAFEQGWSEYAASRRRGGTGQ